MTIKKILDYETVHQGTEVVALDYGVFKCTVDDGTVAYGFWIDGDIINAASPDLETNKPRLLFATADEALRYLKERLKEISE